MTNTTLKQLFDTHEVLDVQRAEQDYGHSLKLVLRDLETGELGVLTVEPTMLAEFDGDDQVVLWYEYREIADSLASSPEHFYNIDTLGRNDKSNVPFLKSEQAGLF